MQNNLRSELKFIASLINNGTRVLDIGCHDGDLLDYLAKNKNIDARGIEIEQTNVSKAVQKGLSVIQGDADLDLKFYPDNSFDYVISSQMLQATRQPMAVLKEMLRIGNKVVVSIPNFGFWYNRMYLLLKGRMPVSSTLSYQWYETPNIHFSTIKDFEILCADLNCKIEKKIFLSPCGNKEIEFMPNFFGESGVFLLRRG